MAQKQIAFEKTRQQQETLTLSDISPNWAKRLGEQSRNYLFLCQLHGYDGGLKSFTLRNAS